MSLDEIIAQLKKEYIESFPEKITLFKKLGKNGDLKSLELEFHKLKGTGTTYHLPEISEMGSIMEDLYKNEDPRYKESLPLVISMLQALSDNETENAQKFMAEIKKI